MYPSSTVRLFPLCVGYYLSAGLWNHTMGSRGAMTALMEPTTLKGECLMFWYYMEGTGVGELSIHLQTTDSQENSTKLWTRIGDQGSHWRHGRVTLYSPQSSYQVGTQSSMSHVCRSCSVDEYLVKY